jgi:hypothetical protein
MSTTMDEDADEDMDEGRQLTTLSDRLDELEVSFEDLAEEKRRLPEEKLHQLTASNLVTLSPEQFAAIRSDLKITRVKELTEQALRSDEILGINDWTARLRLYAEQAKDTELVANAVDFRLTARRRLGLMMAAADKAKGGRPYHTGSGPDPVDMAPNRAPALAESGIGKRLADDCRKLARIPAEDWDWHKSKILDKIRNPPDRKSPKIEPVNEVVEGLNLGVLIAILRSASKDILDHKSHKITRADLSKLRMEWRAVDDAIELVWDEIQEEGVVDVKPSSLSTMDMEGL